MSKFARCLVFVTIGMVLGAFAFAAPNGPPASILNEVANPSLLPTGGCEPVHTWLATGSDLKHDSGMKASDPQAENGFAWSAVVGKTTVGSNVIYGPYVEPPSGTYVAFYRLKALGNAGGETVACVDASVNYAMQTLATASIGPSLST